MRSLSKLLNALLSADKHIIQLNLRGREAPCFSPLTAFSDNTECVIVTCVKIKFSLKICSVNIVSNVKWIQCSFSKILYCNWTVQSCRWKKQYHLLTQLRIYKKINFTPRQRHLWTQKRTIFWQKLPPRCHFCRLCRRTAAVIMKTICQQYQP